MRSNCCSACRAKSVPLPCRRAKRSCPACGGRCRSIPHRVLAHKPLPRMRGKVPRSASGTAERPPLPRMRGKVLENYIGLTISILSETHCAIHTVCLAKTALQQVFNLAKSAVQQVSPAPTGTDWRASRAKEAGYRVRRDPTGAEGAAGHQVPCQGRRYDYAVRPLKPLRVL